MNNKLIILLLTMLSVGCGSKTTVEEATDEPEESDSQFTAFDLTGSSDREQIMNFGRYTFVDPIPYTDSLFNNVDIVRIESYRPKNHKEYKDLRYVLTQNDFEAFLFQDTLHLKFFKRNKFSEIGVRVKVVNGEFSTSPYLVRDGSHLYLADYLTPQPYTEVEDFIEPFFSTHKQVLHLNIKSCELGDTVSGNIFYEGRIGDDASFIYTKGRFKGVVKEGKQFTLTTPKKH